MSAHDRERDVGIEMVFGRGALLRKGWRGLPAAEEQFRQAANEQMREAGLVPFADDVDVAVQLDVHVPEAANQPHIPLVVKAYLDALESVAYGHDRQIAHLVVHRRALDPGGGCVGAKEAGARPTAHPSSVTTTAATTDAPGRIPPSPYRRPRSGARPAPGGRLRDLGCRATPASRPGCTRVEGAELGRPIRDSKEVPGAIPRNLPGPQSTLSVW